MFGDLGELWIDDPTVSSQARWNDVPDHLAPALGSFVANGYIIFPGVVDPKLIDRIVTDLHSVGESGEHYILKNAGAYIDPVGHTTLGIGDRISDIYGVSGAAREAIFTKPITQFLNLIFGEPPIAMQSINFEYGSQQAIHQDTAYVVSNRPLSLAATWLALEDVEPGTGELIYYKSSHRFQHYLFDGNVKSWTPARDGQERHKDFLQQLHTQAKERSAPLERFLAKKGDVLVWHADLAHGGGRITKPGQTRRSLVTHFCPFSVKPAYRMRMGDTYHELLATEGGYFTSRHYDLSVIAEQGYGKIIYDGGVTKRRLAKSGFAKPR